MDSNSKVYTFDEVAKHNHEKDCWLIISGFVYDVTSYLPDHPGGGELLVLAVEKDATFDFKSVGHSESAKERMKKYQIGKIDPLTLPTEQKHVETTPHKPTPSLLSFSPLHVLIPLLLLVLAFAFPYLKIKA
ncbi:cytochrome b5-like [Cucurbita moschata]|uniref:Cytochrome b5-like n=1 Tax=Cucurbita moschata TaxID=3662 RepID=A0A6J1HJ10_CUCMO|nr:cytochrome b5-like [Cucurbita moschata]